MFNYRRVTALVREEVPSCNLLKPQNRHSTHRHSTGQRVILSRNQHGLLENPTNPASFFGWFPHKAPFMEDVPPFLTTTWSLPEKKKMTAKLGWLLTITACEVAHLDSVSSLWSSSEQAEEQADVCWTISQTVRRPMFVQEKYHKNGIHMGVSWNGGTPKSSHFNRIFHYKPSILGYPHLWKPPYDVES